ncbi:Clp protease ClpP [Echinicola soli]|uniref:Clp protease ClpP n=1 Tax=Echinicola soli TaxID=2591634 RepID=A0A514CFY8_9BACT|nr:Clp protease ClpP [Echinicola soli]QDH78737.1 Clp protease ClpP [Echinicola soli]
MGKYTEYLEKRFDFNGINQERKKQLKEISRLRGGRDLLVYAADLSPRINAPISIEFADIMPFKDQLNNLKGNAIDIILETPGGSAEVVEDLVDLVRSKYKHVGIIIPGSAKSAGTIFSMAGDEILMGPSSSLGPIDAQIMNHNKRYSAEGFLTGLNKIKEEVERTKKLNPAYIPILQNISPGEIQHCENAQNFSQKLVTQWLSKYKFQDWETHSSTRKSVTTDEKEKRAREIAAKLCNHSAWLTHGRSIKIKDFQKMRLLITDYSKTPELDNAITNYYTLLRMTLESTNMYKLFETPNTQIYRYSVNPGTPPELTQKKQNQIVEVKFTCPKCKSSQILQGNFDKNIPIKNGNIPFPKNSKYTCPRCGNFAILGQLRMQIESQFRKPLQF